MFGQLMGYKFMTSKSILTFASFFVFCSSVHGEDYFADRNLPIWGGVEIEELNFENDFRNIDISVPLPPVPYLPKITFHKEAYQTDTRHFGWQTGGAQSFRAHLPLGLTLEAGHRLDNFGNRKSEFVGLTFKYSRLKYHHEDLHYGRLNSNRGAGIPGESASSAGGGLWSIVGPIAMGAALGLLIEDGSGSSNRTQYVSGAGAGDNTDSKGNGTGSDGTDNNQTQPGADGWLLVWQDEFDGNSLDTANNWSVNDMYLRDLEDRGASACFGGGNNEAQCYTGRPDNVSVSNGNLELTALIENYTATNNFGEPATRDYTSGRIHTRFKRDFKYGRFEARIKLPKGDGTFPAFWMLPTDNTYGFWPNSGEIDIMENGSGRRTIGGAIHYLSPQSNAHTYQTSWIPNGELQDLPSPDEFNVYRIDWHPDEIRWYFNDQPYWTAPKASWRGGPHAVGTSDNAPFDQDFHIVLNLAMGGSIGGAIDNSQFPAGGHKMLVDYVRVYECEDGPNACNYAD